jgi:hypothetical protein
VRRVVRRGRRADADHQAAQRGRRPGATPPTGASGRLGAFDGACRAAARALSRRHRLEPDAEARSLGPAPPAGATRYANGSACRRPRYGSSRRTCGGPPTPNSRRAGGTTRNS